MYNEKQRISPDEYLKLIDADNVEFLNGGGGRKMNNGKLVFDVGIDVLLNNDLSTPLPENITVPFLHKPYQFGGLAYYTKRQIKEGVLFNAGFSTTDSAGDEVNGTLASDKVTYADDYAVILGTRLANMKRVLENEVTDFDKYEVFVAENSKKQQQIQTLVLEKQTSTSNGVSGWDYEQAVNVITSLKTGKADIIHLSAMLEALGKKLLVRSMRINFASDETLKFLQDTVIKRYKTTLLDALETDYINVKGFISSQSYQTNIIDIPEINLEVNSAEGIALIVPTSSTTASFNFSVTVFADVIDE